MPSKLIQRQIYNSVAVQSMFNGKEVSQFHTRLLRTSLALEESRAYWEYLKAGIPKEKRAVIAFEERWFGSKSMARVRSLLIEFSHRFDTYPTALRVLSQWRPNNPTTRQNICHWHMQLTDPIYRSFTGIFLEQRRLQSNSDIDRDIVARWVTQQLESEWSAATTFRMATGLIATAAAAGLCSENSGMRSLKYPKVTDEALVYWLYFLRDLYFEGSLLSNPYFNSVGLFDSFLEQRLTRLPGLSFTRMGNLYDFGWHYADLTSWAKQILGVKLEQEA
ncbi:BrxA family protein [Nostoc sp.]|uniref:BrxA family protein n=1 Tax=Nostoc sp. TaxID=1180 RepID=UPI002FFD354C